MTDNTNQSTLEMTPEGPLLYSCARCYQTATTVTKNGYLCSRCRDAADAERYRWLRDRGYIKVPCTGTEVDRIVDAKMANPAEEMQF